MKKDVRTLDNHITALKRVSLKCTGWCGQCGQDGWYGWQDV